jgi:formate/nitrite transporter FocA (FNT family)
MNKYKNDLTHIRQMMERSSTFISLSGLSGVGAGIVALIGCSSVFYILSQHQIDYFDGKPNYYSDEVIFKMGLIAIVTLLSALAVATYFTVRKSRQLQQPLWTATTRYMLLAMAVPLLSGGILSLLLIYHDLVYLVAPVMLLFYGIALTNAGKYTLKDIFWLGICEIILGLLGVAFVGYGLIFWGIGFGILHIIYGAIIHRKYK